MRVSFDQVDATRDFVSCLGAPPPAAAAAGNEPEASVVRTHQPRLDHPQFEDGPGEVRDSGLRRQVGAVDPRYRHQSCTGCVSVAAVSCSTIE